MSHIGNKLRAGFFATPERQGEYIYQLLDVQSDGAWFDPTCGEGAILQQIAQNRENVEIKTYGVELDKGRFEKANQVLDHCINAPIESMVIQNDVFSCVFLNPPYDFTMKGIEDNGAERKEYLELVRNTRYLKEGGVMIYVIPSYRFADKKIARHLANYFENIGMLRFSDEDYDDFRQCVFIGTKKRGKFKDFNEKLLEFLMNLDNEDFVKTKVTPLNLLVGKHQWTVPGGATELRTFYTKLELKTDYHNAIRTSKGMEQFKARTKPKELEIGGHPILPLNQGQMALLLASGAVNGLLGEGDDLHLVQGLEIVSKIQEEEVKVHDSGAKTKIMKERTKRDVSVKVITPAGLVRKLV
ncbi:DUF6094 domain-containing protein [Alkalihalobacillus sp. BA299]|uniref:DUF6094 domain-containing protein n=1 Tax=Alkalihalobacillus sp. BA299 TaxID=2815938 RepID=UPI001FFDEF0C|nr:DUF6094 domain-containing protein [Alkalihalobacillus sp. BA299]